MTSLSPLPDHAHLRASHADRERAVDVLKAAFAEGRLDQDEYTERVGQVHISRTYGDLAALTADLPAGPLGTLVPGPGSAPLGSPGGPSAVLVTPLAATRSTSALAVVSLLIGVAGLAGSSPVAELVAVLLGLLALARISVTRQRGRSLAIGGIALSLFWFVGMFGSLPRIR
jgi:hypothetical protein